MNKQTTSAPGWRVFLDRLGYQARRTFNPVQPSTMAGMGVVPNGVTTSFRVWAPHADSVFVTGSFNGWSPWRTPLANEGNGLWSVVGPQTAVTDTYKFLIHHKTEIDLRCAL